MPNFVLKLQYNGSRYHGWQMQNNALSIQSCVENAVMRVFGSKLTVYGCSRTDAGVHANEYYCNFRTEKNLPCKAVVNAVNAYLPFDIVVLDCFEARDDFHSRYDCVSKEYVYKIWNSPLRNPFCVGTAYHYKYKLNETLLDKASKDFIGTYDYSAFCSSGSSVKSTVRTVMNASVERQGDEVVFSVEADGFLYNMVRIMTGTLININEGKIKPDEIKNIILSGNRQSAGVTAPPCGLFLNKVKYKEGELNEQVR